VKKLREANNKSKLQQINYVFWQEWILAFSRISRPPLQSTCLLSLLFFIPSISLSKTVIALFALLQNNSGPANLV